MDGEERFSGSAFELAALLLNALCF